MSKIHKEKFYVRLCSGKSVNFPENFRVYPGSIYGRYTDSNGIKLLWVCDSYKTISGKLAVHFYNGYEWNLCMISTTHPCYKWVKCAIEKIGYVPKIQTETLSFSELQNMMKHDRYLKKGSGSRINTHQINGPLKWNEVTEIAHWYGHGNASVVATNIRD